AHPLIRSAVYGGATASERRRVHRALADALPDHEADRRAWHLALSALGVDDAACSALEQAGERALGRNAFEVASRAFERSSQLAAEEPRRSRLLYAAARTAWHAGLVTRAKEMLERAGRQAIDGSAGAAVEHLKGQIAARQGPIGAGVASLLRAAGQTADPDQAVVILAEAVNAAFYAGDPASMSRAAGAIADLCRHPLGGRASFFATMARGMALTFCGDARAGMELLRRGVALADPDGFADDPASQVWAALGPLWLRETGKGRALVERATATARSRTAIGVLPYLLGHVAIDHATTDRWVQAEAEFHEAIALARETGQGTDLTASLARLAWLEARQGQAALARAHAGEALALASGLGLRLCEVWAHAALGELDLVEGTSHRALVHLEAARSLLATCGIADVDVDPAPELVEVNLRLRHRAEAARLAHEYHVSAVAKGQPWALARAWRGLAMVSRDEDMEGAFDRALAAHSLTPDGFEAARTLLAYGARLRRERKRVRARRHLRAAITTFDALGARPWALQARRELAATGEAARQRRVDAAADLTPQEVQVAVLLAGGRTTREAAAALFVSPKTVEFHLRSVYRKLGCRSRDELAARIGDRPQSALRAPAAEGVPVGAPVEG
ncbi:MAG TPA: helix-turn-helix transcriptional regulator, partial [Acidimicrobiales bacterium]|nr:helix-turn-helix transcriptional regulator [Acidimicrobiales bacterium]